jgi:hypothetical protein
MSNKPRALTSREDAEAFMRTPGFLARFRRAKEDVIRADERHRIVVALRHHGHARDSTDFYEAADFIERRPSGHPIQAAAAMRHLRVPDVRRRTARG